MFDLVNTHTGEWGQSSFFQEIRRCPSSESRQISLLLEMDFKTLDFDLSESPWTAPDSIFKLSGPRNPHYLPHSPPSVSLESSLTQFFTSTSSPPNETSHSESVVENEVDKALQRRIDKTSKYDLIKILLQEFQSERKINILKNFKEKKDLTNFRNHNWLFTHLAFFQIDHHDERPLFLQFLKAKGKEKIELKYKRDSPKFRNLLYLTLKEYICCIEKCFDGDHSQALSLIYRTKNKKNISNWSNMKSCKEMYEKILDQFRLHSQHRLVE